MNKIIYLFSKSEKKKNPVHVQIFKKTYRLERAQYMRCGSLQNPCFSWRHQNKILQVTVLRTLTFHFLRTCYLKISREIEAYFPHNGEKYTYML